MLTRRMMCLCVAAGVLGVQPAIAQVETKPRTITVSASGYVTAQPDIAQIAIGVVTEAKSAKTALEQNSKLVAAVLAGIKRLGIDPKDIATQQFQVSRIYKRGKSAGNRINGFRVRNIANITVRNIKQTGSVIDRAAELGANDIGAINFVVTDMETKLDEARRAAMRNAVRRAKLYAEAANATLGSIQTVSEQFHGRPRQAQFRRTARMSAAAPIEPGQQKLGVTVHAVWSLK
ncbi:MAG: hypothetical protein ACI89J_002442 [Hyphomicrobiaceae bacterium]|jgi:uncharacterized protein YggE